ncbi:hypothetical protein V5799_003823 [Amblyomma americanum]|uniref:Uncharacterized protein n=1 Tax=Amblyomma americanum TaxID=6943 RepID=A0AAQ4D7V5_AMBAM
MDTSTTQDGSLSEPDIEVAPRSEGLGKRIRTSRFYCLAGFLGVALSVFLLGLVLVNVLEKGKTSSVNKTLEPFCCPDEALMVLRVVNESIDPCDDFYAHVCSRADAGSTVYSSPLLRTAMEWYFVRIGGFGARGNASGLMLNALTKGFLKRDRSPGGGVSQYVEAIASAGILPQHMDLIHTVYFLALLNLRYGLTSVVSFQVSPPGTVLNIRRNSCFRDTPYQQALPFALDAVKKALNFSITAEELLRFKNELASFLGSNSSMNLSHAIETSPFSGLSNRDWKVILDELVFPVHPNVKTVATQEQDRLSDFLDILANSSHHPVAVVYAVVCTAFKARSKTEEAAGTSRMTSVSPSCQVLDFCDIEHAYMAHVVSSHSMNEYVRVLFAKTRRYVAHEALGHALFSGTSEQEITQRLNELRLVLPQDIVIPDVPVPVVSETFAANLLAAHSYAFDVRAARVARKIPDPENLFFPAAVRHSDVIFLPSNLYVLMNLNLSRNPALDLPVLGVDMAAQLWSFLLESSWPNETQKNIDDRLTCFRQTHFNGIDSGDYLTTATAALGVVSAFNAMMPPEWDLVSRLNYTDISLGRLVFLMWVYDKCAALPRLMAPLDVNVALRNSRNFRAAFGCSEQSPMSEPLCCLDLC